MTNTNINKEREMLLKQTQYEAKLKTSILEVRQKLTNFVQSNAPGWDMRVLSLSHTYYMEAAPTYQFLCTEFLKKFEIPIPIGSSNQDSYHHTHFIQAVLFVLHGLINPFPMKPVTFVNICKGNPDKLFRLEMQEQVYHTLWEHVAENDINDKCKLEQTQSIDDTVKVAPPKTKSALETKVDEILNILNEMRLRMK